VGGIDKMNLLSPTPGVPNAPRIAPLEPPYAADVAAALSHIHPSDSSWEPLKLFRTMVRSFRLCDPMFAFARFTLGRNTAIAASYDLRTRELVIDRVSARCGCEYEWGVNMAFYGEKAGITPKQAYSLVHGDCKDACWTDEVRTTLTFVDELHFTAGYPMRRGRPCASGFPTQLIELLVLAGWYHAIVYLASNARVELESFAYRFPARQS
jgi:alkylhydroperoxidase family enzyme